MSVFFMSFSVLSLDFLPSSFNCERQLQYLPLCVVKGRRSFSFFYFSRKRFFFKGSRYELLTVFPSVDVVQARFIDDPRHPLKAKLTMKRFWCMYTSLGLFLFSGMLMPRFIGVQIPSVQSLSATKVSEAQRKIILPVLDPDVITRCSC